MFLTRFTHLALRIRSRVWRVGWRILQPLHKSKIETIVDTLSEAATHEFKPVHNVHVSLEFQVMGCVARDVTCERFLDWGFRCKTQSAIRDVFAPTLNDFKELEPTEGNYIFLEFSEKHPASHLPTQVFQPRSGEGLLSVFGASKIALKAVRHAHNAQCFRKPKTHPA